VSAEGISARAGGKEVHYPASDVEGGWIASLWGEHAVLKLRGGDLVAALVSSTAEANALLAAAGVGAEQRTLETTLAPAANKGLATGALVALVVALLAVLGATFLHLSSASPGSLLLGVTTSIVLAGFAFRCVQSLVPKTLHVGTDGLSIAGALGRAFIPYREVMGVERDPHGVVVLRSKQAKQRPERVLLPCWGLAQSVIHDRIRQAMAVGRGELAAEAKQKLLDREGASFAAWVARLRDLGLGRGSSGYRTVSFERDELAQVLESSSAAPERRIAAALALSGEPEAEVKLRVRAVVDACASESLRIALERASEGALEEAELERAICEEPASVRRVL
jgi:hypothetical protein